MITHRFKADPNSLYVVWIGANNYLGFPDDQDGEVKTVLIGIYNGLKQLVNAGAKHILIANLPDLGTTPLAYEYDEETARILTELSDKHNNRLYKKFQAFASKYLEVDWFFLNVHDMLAEVIDDPEFFGFTNVTDT